MPVSRALSKAQGKNREGGGGEEAEEERNTKIEKRRQTETRSPGVLKVCSEDASFILSRPHSNG